LSPHVAIHRLAALSSRRDELVSSPWTGDKMRTHQFIVDTIRRDESYQSQLYHPQSTKDLAASLKLKLQSALT
jgi:radical SAM superfamily enzyme